MTKKNIIIAGYPKSGTTWASRLVAQIVDCPLQGDWGFDHIQALYKEGEHRDSGYNCYKTHYTYNDIFSSSQKKVFKIIHIVRDPRDIVISGSHYFNFKSLAQKFLKKSGISTSGSSIFNLSQKRKKEIMINAILQGNSKINEWLSLSWKEYITTFNKKDVLTITYENLLTDPQKECVAIATHLGIQVTSNHINHCIEQQSFHLKKKDIENEKDIRIKKLIRKGEQGYWKSDFTETEKKKFKLYLENTSFYD